MRTCARLVHRARDWNVTGSDSLCRASPVSIVEHLVPAGSRDELVKGLADDRGSFAILRKRLDCGLPRLICVFDSRARIAPGRDFSGGPGGEPIPIGTTPNPSDNDVHV